MTHREPAHGEYAWIRWRQRNAFDGWQSTVAIFDAREHGGWLTPGEEVPLMARNFEIEVLAWIAPPCHRAHEHGPDGECLACMRD